MFRDRYSYSLSGKSASTHNSFNKHLLSYILCLGECEKLCNAVAKKIIKMPGIMKKIISLMRTEDNMFKILFCAYMTF